MIAFRAKFRTQPLRGKPPWVSSSRGFVARTAVLGAVATAVATIVGFSGCGSSDDPRSASWSYLSAAVIKPNCATVSCHSRAAAVAGLDFSDADRGYTSLTGLWVWIVDPSGLEANGCRRLGGGGLVVCQREHRSLVVPFDPAQSRLVHMLRAQGAPRMPPDRPMAEADIRLVEKWILHGATAGDSASQQPTPVPTSDAAADGADAEMGALDSRGADLADEARSPDGGAPDVELTQLSADTGRPR